MKERKQSRDELMVKDALKDTEDDRIEHYTYDIESEL